MRKTLKDIERKVNFNTKLTSFPDLEKILNFIKNLPVSVDSFKDTSLEIDFLENKKVRVYPLGNSVIYNGFEKLKDYNVSVIDGGRLADKIKLSYDNVDYEFWQGNFEEGKALEEKNAK